MNLDDNLDESQEVNMEVDTNTEELTAEMVEQVKIINEIINTDIIDNTTAFNILLNVCTALFDNEALNDLDRTLLMKAFTSFQHTAELGENFYIIVNDEDEN